MRSAAAPLLALLAVSLARADVGPPEGKKAVPVTTIVEATEDFPDYAFFQVSFSSTPGPPPSGGSSTSITTHFFVPGATTEATGDRRSGGGLYAVPRTAVEGNPLWKGYVADAAKYSPGKHANISTSEDWSALARSVKKGEVPGGTSIRFGGCEPLPTSDERTVIVEKYRIVWTPAAATGMWRWLVVGAAAFGALTLGGRWLVLRNRRA
ncbi:MAG: hypothetical protein J0I06_02780 [Planctomycetes bacterium]|nr:hypothetical protein [Planctomycetota bacterium]